MKRKSHKISVPWLLPEYLLLLLLRIEVQQSPSKTLQHPEWSVINIQEISCASAWSFRPQLHLHPPQEQFFYKC